MKQVNLGIIGGGTVGSGVYLHWQRNGAMRGHKKVNASMFVGIEEVMSNMFAGRGDVQACWRA